MGNIASRDREQGPSRKGTGEPNKEFEYTYWTNLSLKYDQLLVYEE